MERRKFGIADILILTAGIATGLGLIRLCDPGLTPGQVWRAFFGPEATTRPSSFFGAMVELGAMVGGPLLAGWTPACLAVQLIKPRSRWRRLRRQPGFVACVIPLFAAVFSLVLAAWAIWLLRWNPATAGDPYVSAYYVGIFAGPSVLSCWMTMALCGAWRPQPTWTDRLGRVTGLAWAFVGVLVGFWVFAT